MILLLLLLIHTFSIQVYRAIGRYHKWQVVFQNNKRFGTIETQLDKTHRSAIIINTASNCMYSFDCEPEQNHRVAMCSREEINHLISQLFYHVERAAVIGARLHFKQEQKAKKPPKKRSAKRARPTVTNKRLKQLIRFHSAYFKFLIFALDPHTEIRVPLSNSSSLTLFMTNILAKMYPNYRPYSPHTSRTIVEFLQVTKIIV